MTLASLALGLFLLVFLAFLVLRGQLLLLYFQQEEYDGPRFLAFMLRARAFDRMMSAGLIVALIAHLSLPPFADPILLIALAAGAGYRAREDRRFLAAAKKPLAMTLRASRILYVHAGLAGLLLCLGALAAQGGMIGTLIAALLLVQGAPVLLVLANLLLWPAEKRLQRRFLTEARDKLAALPAFTIGITGSYGKTSTKLILNHILGGVGSTLATPGSVNTLMGISRIVREQLKPTHRWFIAEMGAYGPGSIARLCDLAPPRLSLLTAVGWAHYERFKTVDQVFRAKMEIAEAARARAGRTILNVDMIPERLLRPEIERVGRQHFVLCGQRGGPFADLDCVIEEAAHAAEGLRLVLSFEGMRHELTASIFGLHQAGNIALAVMAARDLGVPSDAIKAALRTVPQIKHRLEVIQGTNQPTLIDDGYNSNPEGFRAALDLLDFFGKRGPGGRRVLITPGMVELGAKHDEAHREIGAYAASRADIVIVILPERLQAFIEGARGGQARLIEVATQKDAEAWLKANGQPSDIVLFENSLPDLYERPLRL